MPGRVPGIHVFTLDEKINDVDGQDKPGHDADGTVGPDGKCYSITSSARARRACGTVRPSAWAVLRLITSSNLVGCSTGRSAGLAPSRVCPAQVPAWR